jgi:hypothetical protein
MTLDLDHVFICVQDGRGAERLLTDFGVLFGRRTIHSGQGTANLCAFFDNAYLELLSRHNDDELRSEVVRPLGLWERFHWQETGASPFGVAFRPRDFGAPVPTWPYKAPFLPVGSTIPIVTPQFSLYEPLVFLSTVSQAPSSLPPDRRPPLEHRGHHHTVTKVTIWTPHASHVSSGIQALCDLGVLGVKYDTEHLIEVEWDSARRGGFHNCQPALPLGFRW